MSRVLFLDVDGCLNTHSTRPGGDGVRECVLQRPYSMTRFTGVVELDKVHALAGLIEECEAQIVVSSSWREAFDSAAAFAAAIGLPPLASAADLFHRDWRTGSKLSSNRHQEISWWLADHRKVTRYAIIDDHDVCAFAPKLAKHFVRTDADVGLTEADLKRVGSLLGYPNLN